MKTLIAPPLTQAAFAPFGEVIEVGGDAFALINQGKCRRYDDLARFDIEGTLGLSLFEAEIRPVPHLCDLLERHPLGSQCFVPMGASAYLVVVAPDAGGQPGQVTAFTAGPHQATNVARNTWHGVLAPISGTGLFAVLDRIPQPDDPPRANLEEVRLAKPMQVSPS